MSELPHDMYPESSELYFQAPTLEELNAQYKGMSYPTFAKLSQDEADIYESAATNNFEALCDAYNEDDLEFLDAYEEIKTLWNFMKWRKYGIPDRDISSEDFNAYMQHYFTHRSQKNSDYGKLTPEIITHLGNDQIAVDALLGVKGCGGEPIFGTEELEALCIARNTSIDNLVEKGVLRVCPNYDRVGIYTRARYALREPYLGMYLAKQLGLSKQVVDVTGKRAEDAPQQDAIIVPLALARWLTYDEIERER